MKMMRNIIFLFLLVALPLHAQDTIRVMTFNIRTSSSGDTINSWKNRREAVIRMIETEQPSIFGLQEACPDQLAYLDKQLPNYRHLGVGRGDGKSAGEFVPIYFDQTQYSLCKWGTFWLSPTSAVPSVGWDSKTKRICTWSLLEYKQGHQKVLFLNTHLDHKGRVARREEVRLIADSIQSFVKAFSLGDSAIVFLTADFNSNSTSSIFNPLKEIMDESRRVCPQTDTEYTFNGFGRVRSPELRKILDPEGTTLSRIVLDHIFCHGVQPLVFRVCRDDYGVPFISDHFPVMLQCVLP